MAASTGDSVDDRNNYKICIIGAGMAGLSAANHLLKNNFSDFVIIEARNRIGGRICSTKIGEDNIELGANWIHGVLGNPIFELAMANGLINIINCPKPHKVVAAMEDGKQLSFPILQEIYEAYVCFLRRCGEYFLSAYVPPDGINSVGEHIKLESTLYLSSLPENERKIRQLLFDCLLKRETCITGCDSMDQVDLLEMGSYAELQGGNISLPGGYSSILEPVTKHIPKDKILLGHPVTEIRWQSEDDTEEEKNKIRVSCSNGKIITADQLICTLPLGVLKKNKAIFNPPLPQYKCEAIDKLMFGTVDKIFLEYDRPFLNPGVSEVLLLWDDSVISDQEDSSSSKDISKTWYRKIYSFTKLSETLLLAWISGREAEYMEQLTSKEISDACTMILRKFLNDPFVPVPKNCLRTSWHSQPWTCGSYTAVAIGSSQLDIEALAEPLVSDDPDGSKKILIAFAGEHTHSSFYSTVHGAYLTGRTAAASIIESKKLNDHCKLGNNQGLSLICEDTSDLSSWIQGISLN
ncbi:spermine oxidase [Microplitis mediator]|uniref:spermine oxidase n=1 Tax=Microplitis mediator TaxID=375433 RepID=UPI0025525507|nr:spermine oxidase [Microplitis mediator]